MVGSYGWENVRWGKDDLCESNHRSLGIGTAGAQLQLQLVESDLVAAAI